MIEQIEFEGTEREIEQQIVEWKSQLLRRGIHVQEQGERKIECGPKIGCISGDVSKKVWVFYEVIQKK